MDLKVFKLAANTKNHKLLKVYDYVLRQKNTFCGDEITISIKAKSKKVYKIGYSCKSCIYTQASAAILANNFSKIYKYGLKNMLKYIKKSLNGENVKLISTHLNSY